ncbi:MAG: 5'/3'-nucleotidase SurE [Planctomycetia bacterium]|nr:5'/3'-nucleotidase SurE [Planctomycetia bacterium]
MKILLTNDDGIFSPGIAAMAKALTRLGTVLIAAPATEQSGVGQAITFLTPLTLKEVFLNEVFWGYAVEGTPVDCIKLGSNELMEGKPDLVVSGINNGLNAGANIIYSGTVAAALEGSYLGITSFAISVQYSPNVDPAIFQQAADCALEIIQMILKQENHSGELFNINIPAKVLEQIKKTKILDPQSIRIVPMDTQSFWHEYERRNDPSGRRYYWLSGRPLYKQMSRQLSEMTDIETVSKGFITITPLDFNPTKIEKLREMQQWSFENVSMNSDEDVATDFSTQMNFRMSRLTDK